MTTKLKPAKRKREKEKGLKLIFEYADFETFSPSHSPQFWYGGYKTKGSDMTLIKTKEELLTYLTTPAKRKNEQRVGVFHNAKYDVAIMRYHLENDFDFKVNPRRPTQNSIYISDLQTEIYGEDTHKPTIIIVDSRKLIESSIGKWGDKLGMPKGETPIAHEWRPIFTEDVEYLERDIDIMMKACEVRKFEKYIKRGLFTVSSVTQASVKLEVATINGKEIRQSSFRKKYSEPEEKDKMPIPTSVTRQINADLEDFKIRHSVYNVKSKTTVLGASKSVCERFKILCRQYWIGQMTLKYPDFKQRQKNAHRDFKSDRYPKKFMELKLPDGEMYDCTYLIENYDDFKIIDNVNFNMVGAMRGGLSYVNPNHQGRILQDVGSLDVNSLYPFILLEYDVPSKYLGFTEGLDPNRSKYYVAHIKRLKATVKEGRHPCLKRNTRLVPKDLRYEKTLDWHGRRLEEGRSIGKFDSALSSTDIELLYENYDVELIEYGTVYYFGTDENFLKGLRKHIMKWQKIKENAKDKHERDFAKLMLNTIWGRWGMYEKEVEEAGLKVDVGDKDTNFISAIYTTAYARYYLVKMMNFFGDDFIYCDTDSVHFLFGGVVKDEEDLRIKLNEQLDPKAFGKWDFEKHCKRAVYLKSKTYCQEIWRENKKGYDLKATTAGADLNIDELGTLENFTPDFEFTTKQSKVDDYGRYVITEMRRKIVA